MSANEHFARHAGPCRNVEIKARVAGLDGPRQVAQQLATGYLGVMDQTDTFFRCKFGRLKLREVNGKTAELIAYSRSDQTDAKASQYYLAPIDQAETFKAAMAAALGIVCVVRKHREVYLIDSVRIHLDRVEGLGEFVEMEAVVGDASDDKHAARRLDELMRHFDIQSADLVACAYADLLA